MDEERGAMFTEERQSAIEKCLRENGKVKVKELSEMFQVTEDCIRKERPASELMTFSSRTFSNASPLMSPTEYPSDLRSRVMPSAVKFPAIIMVQV